MSAFKEKSARRPWMWLSLAVNLGILFLFKYWNFVGTNLNYLFESHIDVHHLLLPLGISFYTFQSLSYTLDAYEEKIKPEKHLGYFCLYVSFFPQLVAGPIERSRSLLPQVKSLGIATIEQFRFGLLLIVWGLFLKLVIADNLTTFINGILFSGSHHPFWLYWVAGALVSIKIYCDFMAYSEIARGLAQLFGVKLTRNFRRPFFAANANEFWQRWHISLTRWIGVYVQLPLLKRFRSPGSHYFVTIATMTIIGLWHGASWNFILFGLFQGILLSIWKPVGRLLSSWTGLSGTWSRTVSRLLMAIAWIFSGILFYISDTQTLFSTLSAMLNFNELFSTFSIGSLPGKFNLAQALLGIALLSTYSIIAELKNVEMANYLTTSRSLYRWVSVNSIFVLIFLLGNFNAEDFIYFEF